MARVIDLKHSTLIGTPQQLQEYLGLLQGSGIVDLKFSRIVLLEKSLSPRAIQALVKKKG